MNLRPGHDVVADFIPVDDMALEACCPQVATVDQPAMGDCRSGPAARHLMCFEFADVGMIGTDSIRGGTAAGGAGRTNDACESENERNVSQYCKRLHHGQSIWRSGLS